MSDKKQLVEQSSEDKSSEEKSDQVSEPKGTPTNKSKQPTVKSKSTSLASVFVGFMSFSALVAVAVAGYIGFLQFEAMSERLVVLEQAKASDKAKVQTIAETWNKNFAQLQASVQNAVNQQSANNIKNIEALSKQLSATRNQIKAVGGRHRSDWLMAEADYLVRIASNRLLLERDHITALMLLVSADERIMLMDDPALQPIREALARDMAVLRLVKRADIAGLAIRISSLIPQLKVLPVLSFQLPEEKIIEIKKPNNIDESWQQSLKNTFAELSVKWFEVRDHARPVTPLMAPETEAILLTNLTLLLQTTQFAILRQHSELYHHSLGQLKSWMTDYFDTSDATVIAFINEIDLLNATTVTEELPKKLESRLLLSREVERHLRQPASIGEKK